jgi:hypothetical protein
MKGQDAIEAAKEAFWQTIRLKLEQLYRFVPKGANSELTGNYVEELVRGFIQGWISPCVLAHGTLHPADANEYLLSEAKKPKQIDGIVYDPRMGPTVIREGSFVVVHPRFCRGIIEVKTSEKDLKGLQDRLQLLSRQYFEPYPYGPHRPAVMGVVVHDPDPQGHSSRERWEGVALYQCGLAQHCPVFILFKEPEGSYEPYDQGIDAMIKAVFLHGWQRESREEVMPSEMLEP